MLLALFTPNWHKYSPDESEKAIQTALQLTHTKGAEVVQTKGRYYIAAGLSVVALLAAYSISQFKNRMRQLQVGFGITLCIAASLVAMMTGSKEAETLLEVKTLGVYDIGFYAPFVALFANIISNRLIRKDERLVRSMDRIR